MFIFALIAIIIAALPIIVFLAILGIIIYKSSTSNTRPNNPKTRREQTVKQILEPQRLSKTRQNAPETTLEDYMVYGGECIHGEDIVKPTAENKKIEKQVLKNEEGRAPLEETRTINPVAENCKEMANTKLDLKSAVIYKEVLGDPLSKRKRGYLR